MSIISQDHANALLIGCDINAQYAHSLLLPETDSYHRWELRWLNKLDTMPRYMRAAKWNLQDAKKRIQATLEWRREFKPELIPPEEVSVHTFSVHQRLTTEYRSESRVRRGKCTPHASTGLWHNSHVSCSILNGFDRDGRPILYMRPGRENTETSPRQLRHLVWCL